MNLDENKRFQLLMLEMNLLQGRFDKYDDLVFRNRGWMVTTVVALLGAALTVPEKSLTYLAAGVPVLFWILEVIWRSGYWYKYVVRYRYLRELTNEGKIEDAFLYDLTHHYGNRPSYWQSVRACAFKLEPSVFYGSLFAAPFIVYSFVP